MLFLFVWYAVVKTYVRDPHAMFAGIGLTQKGTGNPAICGLKQFTRLTRCPEYNLQIYSTDFIKFSLVFFYRAYSLIVPFGIDEANF